MIESLIITDPARLPTSWWKDVPHLARQAEWPFGTGLTILWGPNGCGKSTLLTLMALLMHAEQGGRSAITEHSISALWKNKFSFEPSRDKSLDYLMGATVRSDGQAIRYINPTKSVGLSRGGFDDDFFGSGIQIAMARGSGGQMTLHKLSSLFRDRDPLAHDMLGERINSTWKGAKQATTACLQPAIPVGPLTVLLDEPDLHLDIPSQANLWGQIKRLAKKEQIIVATHSIFAVNVKGATYIDLVPGYLEECRKAALGVSPTAFKKPRKPKAHENP